MHAVTLHVHELAEVDQISDITLGHIEMIEEVAHVIAGKDHGFDCLIHATVADDGALIITIPPH